MLKSTFTLVGLSLFLFSNTLAQQRSINMALSIVSPGNEDTFAVGTSIPFILTLENLGPDALVAGDSVFVQTPDNTVQFLSLQQGLAIGESDTIINGSLNIPVDSTITFNLCATLSDDPTTQIKLDGNPITVTYKDPDFSNNAPCNILTILVEGEDPNSIGTIARADVNVALFPNPATRWVNVELTAGVIESIRMVNILGAEVSSINGNLQCKQSLDVAQLANGIYMLHIQTDKGTAVQKLEILR